MLQLLWVQKLLELTEKVNLVTDNGLNHKRVFKVTDVMALLGLALVDACERERERQREREREQTYLLD